MSRSLHAAKAARCLSPLIRSTMCKRTADSALRTYTDGVQQGCCCKYPVMRRDPPRGHDALPPRRKESVPRVLWRYFCTVRALNADNLTNLATHTRPPDANVLMFFSLQPMGRFELWRRL